MGSASFLVQNDFQVNNKSNAQILKALFREPSEIVLNC